MRADQRMSMEEVRAQVGAALHSLTPDDRQDLAQTRPLVEAMLYRLVNHTPDGRSVLVLGANRLLAKAVRNAGYEPHIWCFGEARHTDDSEACREGWVTPRQLAADELPFVRERFDAIILPLVLEHVPANPAVVLGGLEPCLRPGGAFVVATRNLGALPLRRRALMGESVLPDWREPMTPSPTDRCGFPQYRFYTVSEMESYAREAGLHMASCDYVLGAHASVVAGLRSLETDLMCRAAGMVKQAVPAMRDFILLSLLPATPSLNSNARGRYRAARAADGAPDTPPLISVVLPTHNRSGKLRDSLAGLTAQTYPLDRFEVLVIDDGSVDNTEAVVQALIHTLPFELRYIKTGGVGAIAVRNLGMREARGTIVAHLDDDCRPTPEWIEEAIRAFRPGVAIVGGPVLPKPEQVQPFFSIAPRYAEDVGGYPTANVFYRRDLALAVGGFDESFGGNIVGHPVLGWDADLAWRMRRAGAQSRFCPVVLVYQEVDVLEPGAWLGNALRLFTLPIAVKRVPELAQFMLLHRVFIDVRMILYYFSLAGLTMALVRRHPAPLLAVIPWVWEMSGDLRYELRSPLRWPIFVGKLGFIALKQGVVLASLLAGSVRARRLVL